MSASRRASAALAATVSLVLAREASAAGAPGSGGSAGSGAHWYVETVGAACADQRTAFEREIRLACDALGGTCSVATAPADAELRAVLDCSGLEDSWMLVTRTLDGTVLATLDLSGPQSDRVREAAVEVARDVAPERSLAVEALRFSLSPDQPARTTATPSDTLALAVGGHVSSSADGSAPTMFGVRLLAGIALARSARATLGLAGEAGGSAESAQRAFRGGAGFAFGAPFDAESPMGVAVEGGVASRSMYGAPMDGPGSSGPLTTTTVVDGYAQGTFVLQWPGLAVRPFAALAAAAFTESPHIVASAEAGLTFGLF